ncbi:thioredoxin family protein [Neotamlana laminarinivorans]|uniref:Thioredoxin family protein n=1 Tax=Neotamlana laminarinivorans TaxID=2883124 RepID=A0A9X1I3Z8_9FLAO|nr:thioredoxin family protein [Tamlana laminarinivorans]MCB4800002.1 thioredoxin family protein [Tamlana laminarinivorans]
MKKSIKLILAVCVVGLVSAFTLKPTAEYAGYNIGDIVEDFKLKNIDGEMVSLSDYEDELGVIVTFTCNTCPYAVAYEDRIIALDKKYADKGYPVVAIMPNDTSVKPDDDLSSMKKRAEEKGFTFPYLIDAKQDVYPKFGATKTPHVFVLDRTEAGFVVSYIGAIDNNYKDASAVTTKYVENAVDALIAGTPIKETETKAIGCSIKVAN